MVRLFLLLAFNALAAGVPPYDECKGLVGKAGYEVCQNEAFSRRRLNAGSAEDQYAAGAAGYRAPIAEVDGRLGSAIDTCGKQNTVCIQKCAGKGDCIQACHLAVVSCAGLPSAPGTLTTATGGQAEPPDTYTIEFDDTVSKNR
jgi:hypothetical protein